MTPTVVVTGARGYLGGRLVADLHRHGTTVRALARRPAAWLPVPVVPGDLATADVDALAATFAGADAVVHLAGPNEARMATDVDGAVAVTLAAARRVAAAAAQAGVGRLVVVSTTHVYGAAATPGAVLTPATVPLPRHPYAIARLAVEHLAASGGPAGLVVLRLTNGVGAPAGPEVDRWSLVANDLCRQAVLGDEVHLATSGRQWRDFIALTDVTATIEAAAGGAVPAGTYDLGTGTPIRVRELAQHVADLAAEMLGRPTTVVAPAPEGIDEEPSRIDGSPLAALGLEPRTPLRDALRETLAACASWVAR